MTDKIVLCDDVPRPTADSLIARYCNAHRDERAGILHTLADVSWQPGWTHEGPQMQGVNFILTIGNESPYDDTGRPLGYGDTRKGVRDFVIVRKFAARCLHPQMSGQMEHDIHMATGLINFYRSHKENTPTRAGDKKIVHDFLSRCVAAQARNQRMAYLLGEAQHLAAACLYTRNLDLVPDGIRRSNDFFIFACRYAADCIDSALARRSDVNVETPHCSIENVLKLVYQLKYARYRSFPELGELLMELATTFVHSPENVGFKAVPLLSEPNKAIAAPPKQLTDSGDKQE